MLLLPQSAEKYLKALLQELGLPITRTHNLEHLLHQSKSHRAGVRGMGRGAVFLTRFAVETRYPGDQATRRQATAALRWAERMRRLLRRELGIRARSTG